MLKNIIDEIFFQVNMNVQGLKLIIFQLVVHLQIQLFVSKGKTITNKIFLNDSF